MNAKITLAFALFLSLTFLTCQQGQNDSVPSVIEVPDDWRMEKFEFPLDFAPSIPYKGIQEAYFAAGWGDLNSDEFWTYAFIWYLDEDPEILEWKLEEYIISYFDGIMQATAKRKNRENSVVITPTLAEFIRTRTYDNDSEYEGRVLVHDVFTTNDRVTLHVKVRTNYCQKSDKHIVLFMLCPKEAKSEIFETLDNLRMREEC